MTSGSSARSAAGLKTVSANIWRLARESGLEGMFATELSVLDRRVELAVQYESRSIVDGVTADLEALARQLALTSRAIRRFGESERLPVSEHPATLLSLAEVSSPARASSTSASPALLPHVSGALGAVHHVSGA